MRPGDAVSFMVSRQTAAGAASTGKVLADFTIAATKDGVVTVLTPTVTEGATVGTWREYKVAFTLPSSGPYNFHCRITTAAGTDVIAGGLLDFEVEAADLDSISALASTPVAVATGPVALGAERTLTMVAYRENVVTQTITDQNGAVFDLSGYTNWRFGVWDAAHSGGGIFYTLAAGITGSALGVIAFTVPETAAFYSQIAAAIAAGLNQKTLYYDVIADAGGLAPSTRPLLRGQLTLLRYESAA